MKKMPSVPRMSRYQHSVQLERAWLMRREPTRSEALRFAALRGDAFGFRVRRQVVVGRYIVDMLVASVGLVIEIDGSAHVGREDHDRLRQEALEALGFRVVHVSASQVERDPGAVAERVASLVARMRRT